MCAAASGHAGARSLRTISTMTPEVAAQLRQQAIDHGGSLPSEDDEGSDDESESDSDDDEWLVEEEGRLALAKNTVSIGHLTKHEA